MKSEKIEIRRGQNAKTAPSRKNICRNELSRYGKNWNDAMLPVVSLAGSGAS